MATKPKASTGGALVNYKEQMRQQAAQYVEQEASSGGAQFFSVKSGILTFAGAPMPNNQVAVIIADAIMENVYYEGTYDPNNSQPPMCYAFARNERDLVPHANVVELSNQQHDSCTGCEWNEYASATIGKGKACKNSRRLVLLPAGQLDDRGKFTPHDDPEEYLATAGFGFFRLPVTSVKGFANFVKQLEGSLGLPPHGIYTRMQVVPDAQSQFKVLFHPMAEIPDELLPVVMARHDEAMAIIETPYPPPQEAPPPPPKRQARTGAGKTQGARTAKR